MDFKTLANHRHSVRKFSDVKIEDEKLDIIFESAQKAPSAVNFQPYMIYAIKSSEKLEAIKSCYHREWIKSAPLILVICGKHSMAWKRSQDNKDFTDVDAAILADHITLQAADLGIGSCWVCNFDVAKVREVLDLDADEEPICMLPMGYAVDDSTPTKKRKGIDELIVWK